MSKIVIALGGNALGNSPSEQLQLLNNVSKIILDLVKQGNNIILTHGNGPQVGQILQAMDYASEGEVKTPIMPFPECGSMSQGYIGYQLQQCLQNELSSCNIDVNCVTLITQVLVDSKDSAFNNPSKPIGMFYTKEEADRIAAEKGFQFVEDAGRGYRRVVPSPKPIDIIEKETIKELVQKNNIVICAGGGGVPVIRDEDNNLVGVAAVIDKDRSGALLARLIDADILLILTAVDKVAIHFNTPDQIELSEMTLEEAEKYMSDGEFAKGSMLPKVEACIDFVKSDISKYAIIGSLENARAAVNGENGTIIKNKKEEK